MPDKYDYRYPELPRGRPRKLAAPPLLDEVCSALAHRGRRALLEVIAMKGLAGTAELAATFPGVGRTAIAHHLDVLHEAGLVQAERHPLRSPRQWYYRIVPAGVAALCAWLETYLDSYRAVLRESREGEKIAALLGAGE
jgi:DNA-binding transcriptional ArsR family regulator